MGHFVPHHTQNLCVLEIHLTTVAVSGEASAPFGGHEIGMGRFFLLLSSPQPNILQRGLRQMMATEFSAGPSESCY